MNQPLVFAILNQQTGDFVRVSIPFLCLILISSAVSAHGGRTDSEGCHTQSSTGTRHCHGGKQIPRTGSDKLNQESGYDRRTFMKGWEDKDGDCQDARQEVLISESLEKVVLDSTGCRVVTGLWYDPYTGKHFRDPSDLDIDHFVPLEEAYDSGADAWNFDQRRTYANNLEDEDILIAVSLSANRSKGSRDPSQWMPDNQRYHCEYLSTWIGIKARYGLVMDDREIDFIANKKRECE